jgi:hypothetical protein
MVQYITVGIISLAIFIIVIFFLIAAVNPGRGYQYNTGSNYPNNTTYQLRNPYNIINAIGGNLCHGTSIENAIAIHDTRLWLIGPTRKLWMTDNIEIAKQYSKTNGGIVIINVDPSLKLSNRGGGIYTYDIPDALPFKEYYRFEGLKAIAVVSPQGNRIR